MRHGSRSPAALLLAALLALSPVAAAEEEVPPLPWEWLEAGESEPHLAPDLQEEDRTRARRLLPAVLPLAFTDREGDPRGAPVVGAAFVIRADGVLAASWSVLSRVSRARWLWARAPDGTWMRAIPMGSTWWADVGLLRLVTLRRRWPTIRWGEVDRESLRRPHLMVGTSFGRGRVVTAGRLQALVYFDPERDDGLAVLARTFDRRPSERATLIALHFETGLAGPGAAGSPVFDAGGRCIGLVCEGLPDGPGGARVLVRPSGYVRPFLRHLLEEVLFNPPDLGIRWGPPPEAPGMPATVPEDLLRVREEARGGALVAGVLPAGPANRILWEGDVVLEVEGHPVFGEIHESLALALFATTPGVPTDLVVYRGGRRKSLQVATFRARSLYEDFTAEHMRAAGALLELRR